jgi:aldehyde dehydrogenase (NAD+)
MMLTVYFHVVFQEGQMLRQLLAGSGKCLSLELSGRSAMLVFESADLDAAVEGVVDAGWGYGGQVSQSWGICIWYM